MPLVSVVIPTYNRARFLTEAIESAANQTCTDLEILVVDDGSVDETKDVVRPYVQAGVVKYSWQANRGVSAARNRGIAEAGGQFVAFLDSDDTWMPNHLSQLLEALKRYPNAQMGFSGFAFVGSGPDVDDCNRSFRQSIARFLRLGFVQEDDHLWLSNERLLLALFEVGFPFRLPGSLASRDLLLRHELLFDEGVSFTEEAQLVTEASLHTKFVFVDEIGLLVRRHAGNAGDVCYHGKVAVSYERRIQRMKECFGGNLTGAELRAFRNALWEMRQSIMIDRARNRNGLKRLGEGIRLMWDIPTFRSLKSAVKLLVGAI